MRRSVLYKVLTAHTLDVMNGFAFTNTLSCSLSYFRMVKNITGYCSIMPILSVCIMFTVVCSDGKTVTDYISMSTIFICIENILYVHVVAKMIIKNIIMTKEMLRQ